MSWGLLWLEGPLQSWGHDSRFGRRTTLPFPTRSGILGILCCALGKTGQQREWLASMRHFSQTIIAYARDKRAPLLRDFHMVGSGYDRKDPWEDLMIPKKSDGSSPGNTTGTRITTRFYLQDMAFACALELPEGEDWEKMATPRWAIGLGRKSCIPTDIIWRGLYETESEALEKAAEIAQSKDRDEIFRVVEDMSLPGEPVTLNDVPVAFGPYKEYADRQVNVIEYV